MPGRVLVVDDPPVNTRLLEARLTGDYFEVLVANDGAAALEAAEGERPDIVILDLMMPGMDGVEVCRRLKASPARLTFQSSW